MRKPAVFLLALAACAQTPSFEVASIKLAPPGAKGGNVHRDPAGGLTATNISLRALIKFAYQLQDFQLSGGPGWMVSDRYDLVGKAAEGPRRVRWKS